MDVNHVVYEYIYENIVIHLGSNYIMNRYFHVELCN